MSIFKKTLLVLSDEPGIRNGVASNASCRGYRTVVKPYQFIYDLQASRKKYDLAVFCEDRTHYYWYEAHEKMKFKKGFVLCTLDESSALARSKGINASIDVGDLTSFLEQNSKNLLSKGIERVKVALSSRFKPRRAFHVNMQMC